MSATQPVRARRYSTVAMWFHWIIAAAIVFNLAIGLLHESVPPLRALMPAHMAIGLSVLVLTAARLAWRLAHPMPGFPPTMPAWQKGSALATHWALYALLVLMPLTGWMMVSGGGKPVSWFGAFGIPALPVDKAASGLGDQGHMVLGWLMLALVALHIGAALYHRLVLRDGVFGRMAPTLARN